MLKFIAKILIFVSSLFVFNQSMADRVDGLYDVDVRVTDVSADTRNLAFKQGLNEIFIRVSGDSLIMDKLERPSASRYVKQFSYEPIAKPVENRDGEVLTQNLKIQYNGSSIEKHLQAKGFPVWGQRRENLVVWLVVRDGKNEYVLKGSDRSLFKTSVNKALVRRGVPVRWPAYDTADKMRVTVADIRGGFEGPVSAASRRYSKGPALAGSLIWSGKQWQSSWHLMSGVESRQWSLNDSNYKRLISDAINQTADALGVLYTSAGREINQQLVTLKLELQAVDSVEKFRYIENYLENLNAVESSKPLVVNGQDVTFEITLRGTEEEFLDTLNSDKAFKKMQQPTRVRKPEISSIPKQTIQTSANAKEKAWKESALNDAAPQQVVSPLPAQQESVYRYMLMK